jgi:hypothetical protein
MLYIFPMRMFCIHGAFALIMQSITPHRCHHVML